MQDAMAIAEKSMVSGASTPGCFAIPAAPLRQVETRHARSAATGLSTPGIKL
ncbi:hypothetical protein [Aurantiacibacter xanthus]|uniref:hypothetical protein n=1 Tax=Aurantiacibacter xanthus TaxID=1784712 RepID=UPI00174AE432|nr:hypothetical protein [Aurantiacibacter xanthus]